MRALVLDAKKDTLTEAEWNEIVGKFAPYIAWMDAKKGTEVEGLGIDKVKELLKADQKGALLKLIDADKALEEEALSIEAVDKLLRLNHNFYDYLNNYVIFADFYDPDRKAIFQAGRLYIDQRSTDLCVRVDGPHPEISSLSGMYILYCACKSDKMGKTMNIAAVLTDGDVDGLRPGKNAVFYDRDGNDWSAVVTSIVENPLSLKEAFWAPYKKAGRWISDKVNKFAGDKAAKGEGTLANITESATNKPTEGVDTATKAAPFDVSKFAIITIAFSAGRCPGRHLRRTQEHAVVAVDRPDRGSDARHLPAFGVHRLAEAPQARPGPDPQRERLGHQRRFLRARQVRQGPHPGGQVPEAHRRGSRRPPQGRMAEVLPLADLPAGRRLLLPLLHRPSRPVRPAFP